LQQFFNDFTKFGSLLSWPSSRMPEITCLFVINTNTNFEICSELMPKALILTVIENALLNVQKITPSWD
jgi:hypothetical protein